MSDEQTQPNQDGNDTGGQTSDAGDGFKAITSQEELNRVLDDRLKRERAKFRDYEDVKAKAAEYDRLAEASQSDLERAKSAAEKAEQRATQAEAEVMRYRIASKHGVSEEDAELFLTGSDEETLTRQAERLAARADESGKPRQPRPDPNQGRSGESATTTADQFAGAVGGFFTT